MTKYFFNEGGKMQKFKGILKNMLTVLIFGAMATGICLAFSAWNFPETNLVVVYILSVLLVARLTDGYLYGLIASIGSLLMYNWFFTEPYMTLKVSDPTDFVTFAIMMLTSIITSALTSKVKENAAEASAKEAAARTLYLLTNRLTEAVDMQEIAEVAVGAIGESLSCQAGCLCFRDDGIPEDTFVQQRSDGLQIRRKLRDREELRRLLEGRHDAFVIGAEFWNWPIYGDDAGGDTHSIDGSGKAQRRADAITPFHHRKHLTGNGSPAQCEDAGKDTGTGNAGKISQRFASRNLA